MKIRNISTILLIPFFLAACGPAVKYDPTEVAVPSFIETSVAQATSMPDPTVTPKGEPRVEVSVGSETMSYTTNVVGSDATVNVDAARIQRLGQPSITVDVLNTENGRYIWNAENDAWSLEVPFPPLTKDGDIDVVNPDKSFLFPSTEVVDEGSAALSVMLYFAEHPEIIPVGAVTPQYKVEAHGDAMKISLNRDNQYLWPEEDRTPILPKAQRENLVPYGFVGIFRVKGANNNEIVILAQLKKNTPTADNPMPYMPVFYGFDRAEYDGYYLQKTSKGNIIIEALVHDHHSELVLMLPPPDGNPYNGVSSLSFGAGGNHPNVARMLTRDVVDFAPVDYKAINIAFNNFKKATNKSSTPELPFSARLSTLPIDLRHIIVYPGISQW